MTDWVKMSQVASKGGYPENSKAMVKIINNEAWAHLKFDSARAWQKTYFPRRENEANEIANAGMVQELLVGYERIGEAPYEVACALAEAMKEERLEEVIATLGGWKKAIKCYPKKIRDTLYEQYPGLKIKRELNDMEAAEHKRLQNINSLRSIFDELSLTDKYEFFTEHYDKFTVGEFPSKLKYYLRQMAIMEVHLNQFIDIVEKGALEANDPTLFMFRNNIDDFSEGNS